ncbi:hypothetical protein ACFSFY_06870 [Sporosarcina siberiensis]|uniref:Uncharacterized protein n=1 Tax=Sporosarcina siberiensis TaxID=1365606 RepID=A0ABW4SEG1_9BACL
MTNYYYIASDKKLEDGNAYIRLLRVIAMKKKDTRMILSASVLVGIVAVLSDYIFPSVSQTIKTFIIGLAGLVGALIGPKLFLDKDYNNKK